jgi:hypothetical protein
MAEFSWFSVERFRIDLVEVDDVAEIDFAAINRTAVLGADANNAMSLPITEIGVDRSALVK